MKRGKSFWYKTYTEICPVCCREDTWKERVYDKPKPKSINKRHVWKQVFCCKE